MITAALLPLPKQSLAAEPNLWSDADGQAMG
jgi:hypothetical protein